MVNKFRDSKSAAANDAQPMTIYWAEYVRLTRRYRMLVRTGAPRLMCMQILATINTTYGKFATAPVHAIYPLILR